MSKRCKLLISSTPSTLAVEQNQRRMIDALKAHKIECDTIDGADAANMELRNQLFAISGKRAVYPQCFFESCGEYEFVADWETIEGLMECESLPEDVLKANPTIATFTSVSDKCVGCNDTIKIEN